ncbi:MAG: DUF6541 family protein [Chloroflexia bacterium]
MTSLAELGNALLAASIGLALMLLPGLALRAGFAAWAGRADSALGAPDRLLGALLDSLGLSLAFWPIFLLYTGVLHVPLTAITVGVVLLLLAPAALGAGYWAFRGRVPRGRRRYADRVPSAVVRTFVVLLLLTLGAVVLRFIAVRGLAVPNWGDSLHHTLITQLFIEQQGLPHSYIPYEPVYSFTYHFGFHGLAAIWAMLTGQTAWSAVISVGQIQNALAVPAAYVLTRELFRSRAAALASAVVVGYLSGMPTEYVNWGRYPQLAGQVLLPFALVWFLRWVEAPPAARLSCAYWPRLALAAVGAAGLGLTHYRVLIFYALFVIAYLLVEVTARIAFRVGVGRRGVRTILARALGVGVLGGLIYSPWMGNLLADYLPGLFHRLGGVTTSYIEDYSGLEFLTKFLGLALPLLAVAGLLAVLIGGPSRARRTGVVSAIWTAMMVVAARPDMLHLPGAGALGTFTVGIALYLPLGTLAGPGLARPTVAAVSYMRSVVGGRWSAVRFMRYAPGLAALVAAGLLTAANPGARTVDPRMAYVTPDDLGVLNWVRASTPPGSGFLISMASTYQGRAVTATDAGMWLPLLAAGGRHVSVPPLSVGSEGRQTGELAEQTAALYTASLAPTQPAGLNLMARDGLNYVFLGEQTATISPTLLLKDQADYCALYRLGLSYVFGRRAAGVCP